MTWEMGGQVRIAKEEAEEEERWEDEGLVRRIERKRGREGGKAV